MSSALGVSAANNNLVNFTWGWSQVQVQQSELLHFKLQLRKFEICYYHQAVVKSEYNNMDWINCNSCCRQPGDERDRTFVLTNCGHIFCDLCLAQAESREKCSACNTKCQVMQLSSKMKPDAEVFFLEPGELLKRQFGQVNRLLEFQKEHRVRLVSFHRRILQKYKDLQKQHASAASCMKELEKKCSSASSRVQELEAENRKLRSIISSQGNGGGNLSPSNFSPHDNYPRGNAISQKSPTKLQSPLSQDGTRISPGRLTLVKTAQGSRSGHSPTNLHMSPISQHIQQVSNAGIISPPNALLPSQVMTLGSRSHTPQGNYFSPPQPQSHPGHLSQRQLTLREDMSRTPTLSGGGMYRNQSPAPNCNPSPTRSVSNSVGRLTLASSGQQQTAGKQHYQYPSYTSSPLHHGSQLDLHLMPQSRPLTPRSVTPVSMCETLSSKMQMQGHHNAYNKFM